jgi:dihydrofolate reductase
MRKIIVSTMMSLDGVEENPQNWSFDYWNDEIGKYASDQLFASDALVMGRITYEAFAEAWSSRAGNNDPFTDRINAMPKYVASRTATEPLTWNSTLIKGDVADAIHKLKEQPGQDILQYGCGELTYTMIEAGLVDELRFLVYPVAVGSGGRIFEQVAKTPMKLLSTQAFATGVIAQHYQPQGSR